MKDKYLLFIISLLLLMAGCDNTQPAEEPSGMPRAVLLHDYLPGVLPPASEDIKLCDDSKRNQSVQDCLLIRKALAGSSNAALQLATLRKHDRLMDNVPYWYTVAAENGDVRGMEHIGLNLYFKPFPSDPVGSKTRGRFWLELAAKNGSKKAQEVLQAIPSLEKGQDNAQSIPVNATNQMSSSGLSLTEEPMIRCGAHQRCEEIPLLERQALAGSGQTALYLQSYLSHYGYIPGNRDYLYWGTIAAENDYVAVMGVLGSFIWHLDKPTGSEIRGIYWLEKAAKGGDEFAIHNLKSFAQ